MATPLQIRVAMHYHAAATGQVVDHPAWANHSVEEAPDTLLKLFVKHKLLVRKGGGYHARPALKSYVEALTEVPFPRGEIK